jgi:hypothetical protein
MFVVPTIDLVACPDGCADLAYTLSLHQSDVTGAHGLCNLCVNAIAVDGVAAPIERLTRLTPLAPSNTHDLLSSPPPLVERPPRRS